MRKSVYRFLLWGKEKLIIKFIFIFYLSVGFLFVNNEKYLQLKFIISWLIALIISFLLTIIQYKMNKNIVAGLCFKVREACEIKEQYSRYENIKKCIEQHKNDEGKCEVNVNINVVEAAIKYDQAFSVVFPTFITAISVFFLEPLKEYILSPIGIIISATILMQMMVIIDGIPKNAFVGKVIEGMKEEKYSKEKKKSKKKK